MDYVSPFDLYQDWKRLDFAKEVAKSLIDELKEAKLKESKDGT